MGLLSDKKKPAPSSTLTGAIGSPVAFNGPPSYDQSARDQPLNEDGSTPPSAEEINRVNLTGAFDALALGSDTGPFPSGDTCLAHLKLLFAIQGMKEEVGYSDGLWDIWDSRADNGGDATFYSAEGTYRPRPDSQAVLDQRLAALSKLREKRWAIFLARAVDRYAAWWASLLRPEGGLVELDMQSTISMKYAKFAGQEGHNWDRDWIVNSLPPLGKHPISPLAQLATPGVTS